MSYPNGRIIDEVLHLAKGKINPQRRAIYKEIARKIVNADRLARKHGASQNTIGEIERALVAAFLDGSQQCGPSVQNEEITELSWIQIPPRSRDTLSSLTFSFSTMLRGTEGLPSQIERFEEAGKLRWREVDLNGERADHSVADGSAKPLIGLGLIEPSTSEPSVFHLTDRAIRICRDYWKRSDRNDPTLPKISLR